jgi:hypothetical protein
MHAAKKKCVSKLTIAHHMSVPNWPNQFYDRLLWAVGCFVYGSVGKIQLSLVKKGKS